MPSNLKRRTFTGAGAAATAFTIVPRHVLGGAAYVAPSDKITLAHIGMGTESFMEIPELLARPDIQVVAICDPNSSSSDYVEWSKGMVRNAVRKLLGNASWRDNDNGCPGGREVGKEVVETYYANHRGKDRFRAVNTYADFRQLLEKEKDIDAVKIMTPDHLHATISIAAMKKGCNVLVHKPLANRIDEAKLVIDTAAHTKVATFLLAYGVGVQNGSIAAAVQKGVIGQLKEIHNWSNRPAWPQYAEIPTEQPPLPKGFDWDLWLGPSLHRPYHPHYTHATFRGWYEFGGGSMADMGIYSLWPVFEALRLGSPVSAEAYGTHINTITDHVSRRVMNNWSFPFGSTMHFRFGPQPNLPALQLFWYDGGMRPQIPEELAAEDRGLGSQGILFVGDKGKIIAGFMGQDPQLLTGNGRKPLWEATAVPPAGNGERSDPPWLASFKGGPSCPGNFASAAAITDTVNLGAVALRARSRVVFDAANMRITNSSEANQYLYREYRDGWKLSVDAPRA